MMFPDVVGALKKPDLLSFFVNKCREKLHDAKKWIMWCSFQHFSSGLILFNWLCLLLLLFRPFFVLFFNEMRRKGKDIKKVWWKAMSCTLYAIAVLFTMTHKKMGNFLQHKKKRLSQSLVARATMKFTYGGKGKWNKLLLLLHILSSFSPTFNDGDVSGVGVPSPPPPHDVPISFFYYE